MLKHGKLKMEQRIVEHLLGFTMIGFNMVREGPRITQKEVELAQDRWLWVGAPSVSHRPKKHLQLVFVCSRANEELIGESQQEPSSVDEVGKTLRQQRVEVGGGCCCHNYWKKKMKWLQFHIKRCDGWWEDVPLVDESRGKNPESCRPRVGCSGVTQCVPESPAGCQLVFFALARSVIAGAAKHFVNLVYPLA